MKIFIVLLIAMSSAWALAGLLAVLRVAGRSRSRLRLGLPTPPITVLKPLCGADSRLEENLETFFRQDYPEFQIVFGVESPEDPAVAVVERLRLRFPHVSSELVVHSGGGARNPKVSNLLGMVSTAQHDLVLISDSNVSAPSHYLSNLAQTFLAGGERVGLVTNMFAGVGETSLPAALENVQLNGFIAAGSALPTMIGDAAVVGKSMLFRRSVFDRLGGLQSVSDVLAEDFIIGKMFQHGGYSVRLAPTVLQTFNGSLSLHSFIHRQLRWSMMRIRLRPYAFIMEPVTSPLVMLPAALALLGPWAFLWAFSVVLLREVIQWCVLRGWRRVYLPVILAPVREAVMLGVWLVTPFVKYISWRGHRVRLGAGTRVFTPDPLESSAV